MKTALKTYRDETKFARDRATMEAGGWRVKSWQRREERIGLSADAGMSSRGLEDLGRGTNPNLLAPGEEIVRTLEGLGRVALLPFWPLAWAWAKLRSGERWDVLYERP